MIKLDNFSKFKYDVAKYMCIKKELKVSDIIYKFKQESNKDKTCMIYGEKFNRHEYKTFLLNKINKLKKYKDLSIDEFIKVINRGEY